MSEEPRKKTMDYVADLNARIDVLEERVKTLEAALAKKAKKSE